MRIAAFTIGIGSCLVILIFALGSGFSATEAPFPVVNQIHYYRDPSVSLNSIELQAYYVVPAGTDAPPLEDWRSAFDASLLKIARFHSVQFLGKSNLQFEIAPEAVKVTAKPEPGPLFAENPAFLDRLAAEVHPAPGVPGHYRVLLFVVEGGGMGGRPGMAYVPAALFRDPKLAPIRESVIYHAIGEAFGLPHGGEGVMGAGAFRPLETTFLEPELQENMGLID